ncbi:MAG: hypothetical protein HZB26_03075 [Candidatus Hydrogenedentes bacterium]|nr:hypothetical protein [Candidatus Hydrogenedentota bacterium]
MTKKNDNTFVAGWTFWGIVFVVLSPPAIYYCMRIVDPEEEFIIPVGMGFLLAALGAGIVAWAANAALQWFQKRRKIETRKKTKK